MADTETRVVRLVLLIDDEPIEPTPEILEELVRQAYADAKVPVQPRWISHQCERATSQLGKLTEILGSILS